MPNPSPESRPLTFRQLTSDLFTSGVMIVLMRREHLHSPMTLLLFKDMFMGMFYSLYIKQSKQKSRVFVEFQQVPLVSSIETNGKFSCVRYKYFKMN